MKEQSSSSGSGTALAAGLREIGRGVWPLILIALLAWVAQMNGAFNHDVAFTMLGAEALLNGGQFGVDVLDPNPPLSWWIAMVPAFAASLLAVRPETAAIAFVVTVALTSLFLTARLLKIASPGLPRRALLGFSATVLLLAPGYHFGQREHLMLAGALPWLAATAAAVEGVPSSRLLRLLAGVLAGLAFCLKPYFLLVPLTVETWVLVRTRQPRTSLRAENLSLAGTGLCYAAAILVAAPEYLWSVVPDTTAIYWAFDSAPDYVFLRLAAVFVPLLLGGLVLSRGLSHVPAFAQALAAATVGAGLAALLQQKAWAYHLLPILGLGSIACTAIFLACSQSLRPTAVTAAAAALVLITTFAGAAADLYGDVRGGGARDRARALATALIREGGPRASVFAFITSPRDVHPAVLASGARWISAACCVHWLPADVRAPELSAPAAARAHAVAQSRFAALLRDLERARPKLILIDEHPRLGFRGQKFQYLPYLLADPRFRKIWSAYEERAPSAGYRIFARSER